SRLYAKHLKEIRRYNRPLDPFGIRHTGQINVRVGESGNFIEHGLLRTPIEEVSHRNFVAFVGLTPRLFAGLPQCYQPFRLLVRKRSEKNGIDDAEDCGVRAYTKGQ